jgi:hypothetical protein
MEMLPSLQAGANSPMQWLEPIETVTGFLNGWGTPPSFVGFRWNASRRLYDVDLAVVRADPTATALAREALQLATQWTYLQPYRPADGGAWRFRWMETVSLVPRAGDAPYVVRGELGSSLAPSTVMGMRAVMPPTDSGGRDAGSLGVKSYAGASAPVTPLDLAPDTGAPAGFSGSPAMSPFAQYRLEHHETPTNYAEWQERRAALQASQGFGL